MVEAVTTLQRICFTSAVLFSLHRNYYTGCATKGIGIMPKVSTCGGGGEAPSSYPLKAKGPREESSQAGSLGSKQPTKPDGR